MDKSLANQNNVSPIMKFDIRICLLTFLTAVVFLVVLVWDIDISGLSVTKAISIISVWSFFLFIFIMMLKTGNTHKFRSIAFFSLGFMFAAGLILNFNHYVKTDLSGTNDNFVRIYDVAEAVIYTMNLPGKTKGIFFFVFMFLLVWGGATLAFGRGFCSWICPVGGTDDKFSSFLKNPYIKVLDKKWLNLPFAILIVIALLLFGKVIPTTHCAKDCPSKNIIHAAAIPVSSFLGVLVILSIVFIALAIVLPLLTGKRTMCSFICPIGRIQSLISKIGLIRLVVKTDKCTRCNKCMSVCTSFGISECENDGLKISGMCTKCMKCHESCPASAISLQIQDEKISDLYFIYPAFMFMVVFGIRMMANSVYCILNLFV